MVENQCESNCECVETQSISGNNNDANECCQMTNKTSSSSCCSDDPMLQQNHFWKDLSLLHLQKYMWVGQKMIEIYRNN